MSAAALEIASVVGFDVDNDVDVVEVVVVSVIVSVMNKHILLYKNRENLNDASSTEFVVDDNM